VGAYVEAGVSSITNQTYQDLDIICVDDCSTDDTFHLLERMATKDSRIKLYRNEYNLGLVATLNKLVALSNTEFLVRMDPDDISPANRVEKLLYEQMEGDYDIVSSDYSLIDEKGTVLKKRGLSLLTTPKGIEYTAIFNSPIPHSPSLIKKKIFNYSTYDENFKAAEDYRLWTVLFLNNNIKVKILHEMLYEYRMNSEGMSFSNSVLQSENHIRIAKEYTAKLLNLPVDNFRIWEISRGINFDFSSYAKIKRCFDEVNIIKNEFIKQNSLTKAERREITQYTAQYLTFTYLKAIMTNAKAPLKFLKVVCAVSASLLSNIRSVVSLNNLKWLTKQI
jgi:glycosyltransferase involved in cell wall biosynthesis